MNIDYDKINSIVTGEKIELNDKTKLLCIDDELMSDFNTCRYCYFTDVCRHCKYIHCLKSERADNKNVHFRKID